jgi:hypothetical protein
MAAAPPPPRRPHGRFARRFDPTTPPPPPEPSGRRRAFADVALLVLIAWNGWRAGNNAYFLIALGHRLSGRHGRSRGRRATLESAGTALACGPY